MSNYKDPKSPGYGPEHQSGKPCIVAGCKEPAGSAWGPHWCFKHNVERIDRINIGFAKLSRGFEEETKS